MKSRKGKNIPAGEMTDEEVGETLFGKRAVKKVRNEIEESEPAEAEEEKESEASIGE